MAVTAAPVAQSRPPGTRHFVRLKLRILRNGMRGSGRRIALFIFGVLAGLWAAFTGFAILALGSVDDDPEVRLLITSVVGAGLVLSWVLAPLLFFGVDETLDPARFALLPIPRRTLALGMLAAACVGIAPLATLLASFGVVVGAAIRAGSPAVAVAVLGAFVGLLVCIVASRAVTSAFAGMLRTRKVRDLAAIIMAVLASSVGPAQLVLSSMLGGGNVHSAVRVARVIGWTPLAAPYVAVADAINGDWLAVAARLAIGVATIVLLLWWWSHTVESAMVGTASAGQASKSTTMTATTPANGRVPADSLVTGFIPAALRSLPANPFGAIVARECRYWWREPRRRAGMVSLLMASLVIPFVTRFSSGAHGGSGGLSLPISLAFAGVLVAMVLANQFGTDGTQYGMHLLTGVRGGTEVRARATALAVLALPVLILVAVGSAVVTGGAGQLLPALGTLIAGFGVSLGVASLESVLAPYPMPDSTNPFAVNTGGTSAKGLLALLGMVGAFALVVPVLIAYFLLPAALSGLVLPLGMVWGAGGALLGLYIAGDALDRRGPEVLSAVTPRR